MGPIQVQTPELALAASVIGRLGGSTHSAEGEVASALGEGGAFGGEPVGDAFLSMCVQAQRAVAELGQTVDELSRNVAMAALGYLNTDQGVIPIAGLPGFRP